MNLRIRKSTLFVSALLCIAQSRLFGDVILTFDPSPGNGASVHQAYGDRVTAVDQGGFRYGQTSPSFTPNIEVSYSEQMTHWEGDYGDLENVLYSGSDLLDISLIADPGYEVLLHGFDLAGWPNNDYSIPLVSVSAGIANLFSSSDVLIQGDFDGPRRTQFVFDSPLRASMLGIHVDTGQGSAFQNIGIDNIRFSQVSVVPEPSSASLLAVAGFVLAAYRRRNWVG